jgi:hypothetical protein
MEEVLETGARVTVGFVIRLIKPEIDFAAYAGYAGRRH